MRTFTFYPKDGGKEFAITKCQGFSVDDSGNIVVHNFEGKRSRFVSVSTDDIAAVVSDDDLTENLDEDRILYSVVLKKRDQPLQVLAGDFTETDKQVIFRWIRRKKDLGWDVTGPLDNCYFAATEVVAIFPSNGLDRKWYLE